MSDSSIPGVTSELQSRRIPDDYAMALVTAGWRITKKHYPIIIAATLTLFAIIFAISSLPFISILAPVPSIFLGVGMMKIVRDIVSGQTPQFKDLFHVSENQKWLNALLPLGAAGIAVAIVQMGLNEVMSQGVFASLFGSLFSLLFSLIWFALTAFSAPLIVFRNRTFAESIDLNLKATVLNWKPLLIYSLYLMGLALICTILLLVPLIMVFLPILVVSSYLCYASLFEDLDLQALVKSLEET